MKTIHIKSIQIKMTETILIQINSTKMIHIKTIQTKKTAPMLEFFLMTLNH